MHHLLLIHPVKLEWLTGVACLPVPICALCRRRVQSLSPSPTPPHPGGVGKHEKIHWGELKMYHFATSLSFCALPRSSLVMVKWQSERGRERGGKSPGGSEQNFKPCWVPVLFVRRALSLTSDSLSLARSPVSRLPQHAGLALSLLFDIFICSAKATGWLACELSTKVDYSRCLSPQMTYLKQNNRLTTL